MKQYFVPHEIAKVLKEIGFNQKCIAKWTNYNPNDPIDLYPQSQNFFKGPGFNTCINSEYRIEGKDKVAAPLYDQVIQWFIDKHSIHIEAQKRQANSQYFPVIDNFGVVDKELFFDSRKEALNAGILKAIELIKQKK